MPNDTPTIPYGFCHCGCGQRTKMASITRTERGNIKGQPLRFINGHNGRNTTPILEAIIGNIVKTDKGCWEWQRAKTTAGYGLRMTNGVFRYIHREVAFATFAKGMDESLSVLHHCDNPPCCNPEHLFLGTSADNAADKVAKGRQMRGERHWNAKLTEADVVSIRLDTRDDKAVAAAIGVGADYIKRIRSGKIWKHVSMGPNNSLHGQI